MVTEIETPGELEMLSYLRIRGYDLPPIDVGKAFLAGDVDEFHYREYLDKLQNLYLYEKYNFDSDNPNN